MSAPQYPLSYGQRSFLAAMPVLAICMMTLGLYFLLSDDARAQAKWQADMSTLYYLQSAQKHEPAAVWSSLSQSRIHALQALAYQPFDRSLWQHVVRLDDALYSARVANLTDDAQFSDQYLSQNIARRLGARSVPAPMLRSQADARVDEWAAAWSDIRLGALSDQAPQR